MEQHRNPSSLFLALGLVAPLALGCAAAPESSPTQATNAPTMADAPSPSPDAGDGEEAEELSFSAGSDDRISASIRTKLTAEPDANLGNVEVVTQDGVVTLRGKVPDSSARNTAASIADGATGVLGLVNELEVEVDPK